MEKALRHPSDLSTTKSMRSFRRSSQIGRSFFYSSELCQTLGYGLPDDGGWHTYIDEHMKKNEESPTVFVCAKPNFTEASPPGDHSSTRVLYRLPRCRQRQNE